MSSSWRVIVRLGAGSELTHECLTFDGIMSYLRGAGAVAPWPARTEARVTRPDGSTMRVQLLGSTMRFVA